MSFYIVRTDITRMRVDAIVNAANTNLTMGGGVCGAIFQAAGITDLQRACEELGPIDTGKAISTPAFSLHAQYIIHTAGPIYKDGKQGEETLLQECYTNSLHEALHKNCASIAFPLISSGIYGYPPEEALSVAKEAILAFLAEYDADYDMDIYLVLYANTHCPVDETLFERVQDYISQHHIEETPSPNAAPPFLDHTLLEETCFFGVTACLSVPRALQENLDNLDEPFATTLIRLIQAKNQNEVDIYKKANISRKLFSKIRCGKGYMPSKSTILALAIALELDMDETENLLKKAGFAFSPSQKLDVIVQFFIQHKDYNLTTINTLLYHNDLGLLGG